MNDELDEIFVRGIKAYGYHGVFESENRAGQWFFVDLKMRLPLAAAASTDELGKTVDYARAIAAAKACVEESPPFSLIERLAGTIAEELLDAPVGAECADIGVRLSRRRGSGA